MNIFDNVMTEPTRPEEVMVVTLREVIEGALFHNENLRLSDALNAESSQYNRYVCLKNASVYSVQTGKLIFRTNFLLVSHQYIIYMTPRDCVVMKSESDESRESAVDSAGIAKVAEKAAVPSPSHAGSTAEAPSHPIAVATMPMEHPAVVLGPEGHLLSQQAMLEKLAAIRGKRKDVPAAAADKD